MDVEWAPIREPAEAQVWREVIRPLAAELHDTRTMPRPRMVQLMRADLPDVMPDAEAAADNEVSTEETLRSLAQMIERECAPDVVTLPPSTVAFARAGMQRQVPLTVLMRSYRVGHELVWQWFYERILASTDDGATRATATRLITTWLFGFIDATVTLAEQAYEVERERWLRSAHASRGEAITAILAGTEHDGRRASRRLRYELNRDHVGIAATADKGDDDSDPQSLLAEAVGGLAAAVSADPPLVFPSGVTTCLAWLSRARRFTDDDMVTLAGRPTPGVRIALGESSTGLDGFRRTQREAGHARRVASDANLDGCLRYADVAVIAMATVDAEQAASFVARILGPLAADDEVTRRTAETLAVYLEENRSRSRAAARLYVHANTVNYRVRQAEQILGRGVDSGGLDLQVALALLPAMRRVDHPGTD